MSALTITFRVDATEHRELLARAERDRVSMSDYIRVRLGLRGEGPQDGDGVNGAATGGDTASTLADHERRLVALEAERAADRDGS